MTFTPGKVRRLATLSTAAGTFKVLAIDHRDSMRVLLNSDNPAAVAPDTLTDLKLNVIRHIAPDATAVMLEPEYSAAQAITSGVLPGHVGFLCALESQGYAGEPTGRETYLLNGWSVEKAVRLGTSAIKLLIYYHPDAGAAAEAQEATVSAVITDCARYDIPLFLEPIYYSPNPSVSVHSPEFSLDRRRIVVETVRRLGALRPDVLKIQFPLNVAIQPDTAAWVDACTELNETSPVPWALLSAGVSYETFRDQVEIACRAGCSGFMVGRALWREVIDAAPTDRASVLQGIVLPRFRELATIVDTYGQNWREKHTIQPIETGWYRTY